MLRNKSKAAIGTSLVLILFGVILGSLVNVQGPSSDVVGANVFQVRNNPILMQVGKDGRDILGYSIGSPNAGWENSHLIQSFSFGMQADSEAGTKTPGIARFMEIAIIRYSDGATPVFFQNIATGTLFSSVSLSGWGLTGGSTINDWEIILENVIFTSMAIVGTDNSLAKSGGGNLESITFNYQKITMINTVLNSQGNSETASCWDVKNNREC